MTPLPPPIPVAGVQRRWTMVCSSSRVTCAVITRPSGGYILRLTCNGTRLYDEHHRAMAPALDRSRRAFDALSARGWLAAEVAN